MTVDATELPEPLAAFIEPGELSTFAVKVFGGKDEDHAVGVLQQLPTDSGAGTNGWGVPLRDREQRLAVEMYRLFDSIPAANLSIVLWSVDHDGQGSWRTVDVERPERGSTEPPALRGRDIGPAAVTLLLAGHQAPPARPELLPGMHPRRAPTVAAQVLPEPTVDGHALPMPQGIAHANLPDGLDLAHADIKVFNPTPNATVVVLQQTALDDGTVGLPLRYVENELADEVRELFNDDTTILEWSVDKGVGHWRSIDIALEPTRIRGRFTVAIRGEDVSQETVDTMLGGLGSPPAINPPAVGVHPPGRPTAQIALG